MKKIPPEIDSLMWAVAENPDPATIDDFESRYPDHRYELGRRLATVRALKGSKPMETHVAYRSFRPTPTTPRPTAGRWAWVPVAAGLCIVAVAAFFGGSYFFRQTPVKPAPPVHVETSDPFVKNDGSGVKYGPDQKDPIQTPQMDEPVPEETPPNTPRERLYTVNLEDISLLDALQSIGLQAGLDIQIAPGFEDQKITVHYQDMTSEAMLSDMGRQYGFTPMKQGPGEYLLIPAVDNNSSSNNDWNQGSGANGVTKNGGN